jgi:hypothetical protein
MADDAPERPRLTDGEKKANHIASGELAAPGIVADKKGGMSAS